MKKIKQYLAAGICIMLMSQSLTSFAETNAIEGPMGENQTPAQKMGVSEEDYQRYMDNRLEYSEIDALVHYFNPSIAKAWRDYQTGAQDIIRNISDLEAGQRMLSSMAQNSKDEGDLENYGMYKAQENALDQMVKSLNKSKKILNREVSINNEELRNSERQVSHAVKSLMVNYLSAEKQVELMRQGIALSEQSLEISKKMVNAGMSITQNTIRANSELTRNRADLQKLLANVEDMRRTLITMVGFDINAQPSIEEIAVEDFVNPEIVAAIDLEADIKAAIGNNYELISLRRAKTSLNFTRMELKNKTESQMEANVRNDVTGKYRALKSALLENESKKTALQSNQKKAEAANTKFRLGMISEFSHNESALELHQAKLNLEVSKLNLLLRHLEYVDAVHGNASVE